MKEDISPEEKLLKLIRGEKKQAVPQAQKTSSAIVPVLSENKHLKGISPIIKKTALKRKSFFVLTNKKVIEAVFILSCVYLISAYVYPLIVLRKIELPVVSSDKDAPIVKDKESANERPYESYAEGFKKRRIFNALPGLGEEENSMPVGSVDANLVKDINLVGILSEDNPQAIIEDKKTQKTYYLSKGQFIGELELEEIQEGKIILKYNNQRFELYL